MRAYPYIPGVPAAGHIAARGYWHPGPVNGCRKCAPPAPPKPRRTARQEDKR